MAKQTRTEKRVLRAKKVGEALAVFRERHRLTFEGIEAMLFHAGHRVSLSTIKRLVLSTHTPHATTLAQIEVFLKNHGAPAQIATVRGKHKGVKPRRGTWASGTR